METFLQEMRRYLGLDEKEAALLRELGPRMENISRGCPKAFYAMPGGRECLLAASEADDYLQKPVYDAAELVAKVQGLLNSH